MSRPTVCWIVLLNCHFYSPHLSRERPVLWNPTGSDNCSQVLVSSTSTSDFSIVRKKDGFNRLEYPIPDPGPKYFPIPDPYPISFQNHRLFRVSAIIENHIFDINSCAACLKLTLLSSYQHCRKVFFIITFLGSIHF